MPTYTVFDKESGVPIYCTNVPIKDGMPNVGDGKAVKPGNHLNKILAYNNLFDRPKCSIKLLNDNAKASTEYIKLADIPNPTIIEVEGNGEAFVRKITDGEYEFSIDTPGEYTIKCEPCDELPVEFKVHIV